MTRAKHSKLHYSVFLGIELKLGCLKFSTHPTDVEMWFQPLVNFHHTPQHALMNSDVNEITRREIPSSDEY